jgi:hypothetical protein
MVALVFLDPTYPASAKARSMLLAQPLRTSWLAVSAELSSQKMT